MAASRVARLCVERLEDRLAPATVNFVAATDTLSFTGLATDDDVTVTSPSAAQIRIQVVGDTITLTGDATLANGFVLNGSGDLLIDTSISNVVDFNVDLNNGNDHFDSSLENAANGVMRLSIFTARGFDADFRVVSYDGLGNEGPGAGLTFSELIGGIIAITSQPPGRASAAFNGVSRGSVGVSVGTSFKTVFRLTNRPDVAAPRATLAFRNNVTTANSSATTTTLAITYTDQGGVGVDPASFSIDNIRVANQATVNGFSALGNTVTYTIRCPNADWGSSPQGVYVVSLVGALGGVRDLAGNFVHADSAFTAFLVDTTPLTVTLNQSAGQADPTALGPINFTVVFNKPVTDFGADDVIVNGTAGATTAAVVAVGTTGAIWKVTVTDIPNVGTVVATLPAGVVHDLAGNANLASASTDNVVTNLAPAGSRLLPVGPLRLAVSTKGRRFSVKLIDSEGKPLAGVPITFSIPLFRVSGHFAGGVARVTVLTNAQGVATSLVFRPDSLRNVYYTVQAGVGSAIVRFSAITRSPLAIRRWAK